MSRLVHDFVRHLEVELGRRTQNVLEKMATGPAAEKTVGATALKYRELAGRYKCLKEVREILDEELQKFIKGTS